MRLGPAGAACRSRPCRRLPRPPPPFRPPSASRPSGVKRFEEAGAQPSIAGSLARTLPLFRLRACNAYPETACAAGIWEIWYLPRFRRSTSNLCFGVANLDDEEWARSSSISSPRVGSFDILFVGGHEAICAVAIEPPPPILRPRSRLPHLSDACAHPSAARTRASRVASGRDGRAPHVQGRWVGWVDDAGRASGRLRPHPPRHRRLESHRLDDGLQWSADCRSLQIRHLHDPLVGAGCGSSTTCTARAAGDFAVGARPAAAALAPSAASSSAPPMRRRALYEVHVCVSTGMFRAHVKIFATRSRAQCAYFSPPHSRRSPRRSPPCSGRHRARGALTGRASL